MEDNMSAEDVNVSLNPSKYVISEQSKDKHESVTTRIGYLHPYDKKTAWLQAEKQTLQP